MSALRRVKAWLKGWPRDDAERRLYEAGRFALDVLAVTKLAERCAKLERQAFNARMHLDGVAHAIENDAAKEWSANRVRAAKTLLSPPAKPRATRRGKRKA